MTISKTEFSKSASMLEQTKSVVTAQERFFNRDPATVEGYILVLTEPAANDEEVTFSVEIDGSRETQLGMLEAFLESLINMQERLLAEREDSR